MADQIEDKESLTEQLEEDRRTMAIQADAFKRDHDFVNKIKSAIEKDPWLLVIIAVMGGFLLSRLPARRKEVYLWYDHFQADHPAKLTPVVPRESESSPVHKLWLFIKPLVGGFFVKKFYKYFSRLKEAETSDKADS